MRLPKIVYLLFLLLLFLFGGMGIARVSAQVTSVGVAVPVSVEGDDVRDGSLVCTSASGYKLCDVAYDGSMYGVISDEAAVSFELAEVEGSRPVVSDGVVIVRAKNTEEASIKKGDLVTSSTTPGVVEPAVRNGYVLGVSLEDLPAQTGLEGQGEGKIMVALNIHPAVGLAGFRSNLIDVLRSGSSASLLEPLASLRYAIAASVVVASFIMGFVYFGRVAREGIRALGRNPLASKPIQLSIFFNIVLMIVMVLVGLGIGYLVLIF